MLYGALSLLCLIILPLTTYAYTPLEQTSTFSPDEYSKSTEEIITLIDETPSNYADPYDQLVDFHLQTNVLFLKMDPCLIVLFRIHRESHVSVAHIHMKMDMFTSTQ